MDSSSGPSISIIIAFRDAERYLEGCLDMIAQFRHPSFELILVDDGSRDSSSQIAHRYSSNIVTLSSSHGPAYARNRGADRARGSILLFVDADVLCGRDTLSKVEEIFRQNPLIDAVIGSYDDDPAEKNFISKYKNLTHHFVHQNAAREASTFWTGCGAVRREVFSELGGFSEAYRRPCIEDIELGYRLRAAGHRIALCKELQVKHAKNWSLRSLLRSDIVDRGVPWAILQLSHGRLLNDLNVTHTQRAASLFICLAALFGFSALWNHMFLAAMAAALIPVIFWNRRLYKFYYRRGGIRFAIGAVFMHWFYYLYSTLAFAWGYLRHKTGGAKGLDRI